MASVGHCHYVLRNLHRYDVTLKEKFEVDVADEALRGEKVVFIRSCMVEDEDVQF